jgi:hypothetical protein
MARAHQYVVVAGQTRISRPGVVSSGLKEDPHAPRSKAWPISRAMRRFVEIRSHNLKPGTGPIFDGLVTEQSVPMMGRWGIDLVTYGPSRHDPDSYILIRAYAGLEERTPSQEAFYGSEEWRFGPRSAILACIDSLTTVVLELDLSAVDALRQA